MAFTFTTDCEICGEEYDNYMRTLYVEEKGKRTRVCWKCRNKLSQGKYTFTNHIPPICDGGDLVTRIFENEQQLKDFVLSRADKDQIVTIHGVDIVEVDKTKEFWWVRGSVSKEMDFPNFYDVLNELGYKY